MMERVVVIFKMRLVVSLLAMLSLACASQSYPYEECPKGFDETVENLDFEKLSQGIWYDVKMMELPGYTENKPQCPTTIFSRDLSVTTEFSTPNGSEYALLGHLKNTDRKGGFNITYENIATSGEIQYNFLLAEYDDFLLIFGCNPVKGYQRSNVNSWLLSRTPTISKNAEEKFREKMDSLGLLVTLFFYYKDVDRTKCKDDIVKPPASETTPEGTTTVVPPSTSSESTPGTEATPSPRTETTLQKEPTTTSGTPVYSSPNADQSSTIKLMYAGQGENSSYIRSLLAAQWGMLVVVLLLALFVVTSTLAVYRMLLPYLRARQHDEARTLSFASSDSKTKKTGHYNDGLDVDV